MKKMRKLLVPVVALALCAIPAILTRAESTGETVILFRDIPWGTSYTDVKEILSDLDLWTLTGDGYRVYPTAEIITDDQMEELQFEQSDINIYAVADNKEVDVAGYTTNNVELFFAYIPVDGVLTKSESDSSLYGARYSIDVQDLDSAEDDLVKKLTSLYGEPSRKEDDEDDFAYKCSYTYWDGAKDTQVVLRAQKVLEEFSKYDDDKIVISYVWLGGDELLRNASDILSAEAIGDEAAIYGNNSTNGL